MTHPPRVSPPVSLLLPAYTPQLGPRVTSLDPSPASMPRARRAPSDATSSARWSASPCPSQSSSGASSSIWTPDASTPPPEFAVESPPVKSNRTARKVRTERKRMCLPHAVTCRAKGESRRKSESERLVAHVSVRLTARKVFPCPQLPRPQEQVLKAIALHGVQPPWRDVHVGRTASGWRERSGRAPSESRRDR